MAGSRFTLGACARGGASWRDLTVLYHDVETLLDKKVAVHDNEAKGKWEDIVTAADLEKFANVSLFGQLPLAARHTFTGDHRAVDRMTNQSLDLIFVVYGLGGRGIWHGCH